MLKFGYLLPLTGSLAFLGPPEIAGVQLAIADVNEGGGVLGAPVAAEGSGDSGDTSTDTATQTVDRLLQAGVNVIVGAASSGVSQTVIDTITGAGVMKISPANTSDIFTTYEDNGLYFRTAPPDLLQARALADLILEDGNNSVGILALNDPYGTGLAENTRDNLIDGGLSEEDVPEPVIYDPTAANFDAEVQQMVDLNPDAIIVIGFEESVEDHPGLNERASARSADPRYRPATVADPSPNRQWPGTASRCRATVCRPGCRLPSADSGRGWADARRERARRRPVLDGANVPDGTQCSMAPSVRRWRQPTTTKGPPRNAPERPLRDVRG